MREVGIITSPYALKASVPPLSHVVAIFASIAPRVHVLTGYNGLAAIDPQKKNVKGYQMGTKDKAGSFVQLFKYIYANLKIAFHMIKLSRRVDIWLFFLGEKALLVPVAVGWLLRKKTIFIASGTLADPPPEQPVNLPTRLITDTFKKINMMLATRIVVYAANLVSPKDLVRFRDKICISSEHFLDFDKFQVRSDYKQRENRVGYIARLSKEKGILTLLDTIPLVQAKNNGRVKFVIAGEGLLQDQVVKFTRENSRKSVEYMGWIDHSRLPDILNSLKLLILPSHTEGLPNIMLEAMACGTPVLATPFGAVPDLIKDSENGFIIEDNSPEYNAGKILKILDTPGLEQVSLAGRRMVEKEYTFEKAVERYRRIVDKL